MRLVALFAALLAVLCLVNPAMAIDKKKDAMTMQDPHAGPAHDDMGAIKHAKVVFLEPKDGVRLKAGEVMVKFAVQGMKVEKAGTMVPGTGHHHILLDRAPDAQGSYAIPKGQPVPKDEKNLHFGDGSSQAKVKLDKGDHTLTLQFADGAHMSYGDALSATIHVKVE